MNQKTLKFALWHTGEIIRRAKEIQENTFESLHESCDHLGTKGTCLKLWKEHSRIVKCAVPICPHIHGEEQP